ncbi:hypothetical protein EBR21_09025, partial [bacterium]|nr:hypothetical protein [bacterium]
MLVEKKILDLQESEESFKSNEIFLVKRWLVEEGLRTDRAASSRDILVDYYFDLFHKSSDPHKFHV